jgi:hypothetical protein
VFEGEKRRGEREDIRGKSEWMREEKENRLFR